MNGNEVFKQLSKMTEEERSHCVFPGYFDEEETDILIWNYFGDEEEYEKALGIDKGIVAGFWKKACDAKNAEWTAFVEQVGNEVKDMIKAKLAKK